MKFKRLKNRYWSIISDEIFVRPEHVQFNGIFRRNAGFRVATTADYNNCFIFVDHYILKLKVYQQL